MVLFDIDFEPESFVTVELFYNKNDPDKNPNLFFDSEVVYTRARSEEDNLEETRTVHKTQEFVREWLFRGDKEEIEETVFFILKNINVPYYGGIVNKLTNTMIDLKNREAHCLSPMVERVKVVIKVMVSVLPVEEEDVVDVVEEGDEWGFDVNVVEEEDEWGFDVDVKLAVAPASDEAVKAHLETVVVENDEGYCVICIDEIKVDSDVEVVRMPCLHMFHCTCGEEWLRNSGICPVCRAIFPS